MPTTTEPTATYAVEFRHPYFGWLRLEYEFTSRDAAAYWITVNNSPYRYRVVQVRTS